MTYFVTQKNLGDAIFLNRERSNYLGIQFCIFGALEIS